MVFDVGQNKVRHEFFLSKKGLLLHACKCSMKDWNFLLLLLVISTQEVAIGKYRFYHAESYLIK